MGQMQADLTLAVAGVATHVGYFNQGEHHMHGVLYIRLFLGVIIAAMFVFHWLGQPWAQALLTVTTCAGYYCTGLYGSLLLYRFAFSPLNRFPGPWWAKASSLAFSTRLWGLDAHKKLLTLHQDYGDFVRVGSSDISIIHPQAISAIYGRGSKCIKSGWYDLTAPMVSMQTTRKRSVHDERRHMWGGAFSYTALQDYEKKISGFQDQLIARILELGGTPVNANELFNFFSWDIMGDLAFSTSFNMLREKKLHWAVELSKKGIEPLGWMLPPWCFRALLAIPGATADWFAFMNYCCHRLDERRQVSEVQVPDIMAFLLDPWKGRELSISDMKMLQGDSQLIVVAGSDTTASTLTSIFYELARFPETVSRLRNELKSLLDVGEDISNSNLQYLSLLNGVINEALRLYPPAGLLQRNTPAEGITIGQTFVPGNTTVFCPFFVTGRSNTIYVDANEFRPERWYEKPEMIKEPSAYAPFSTGVYSCVGKPLALLNLRTTLAKIVLNFDMTFAEDEDGTTFHDDMRTSFVTSPGTLYLRFSKL